MQAGRLRHRIMLQEPIGQRDAHGQPIRSYRDEPLAWASVEPLRGKEKEVANQVAAEATVKIIMRYRHDVTSDWRITFDGRHFEIVAPPQSPGYYRRETHLLCKEIK